MNAVRGYFNSLYLTLLAFAGCGGVAAPPSAAGDMTLANARDTAVIAATSLARIAVAARPAADLQAILEHGRSFPQCPSMTYSVRGNTLDLTLAYGAGCGLDNAPAVTLAGQLAGSYFPGAHNLDFGVAAVVAGGNEAMNGSYAGRVSFLKDVQIFTVTTRLTLGEGTVLEGDGTIEIHPAGETVRIVRANARVVQGDADQNVALTNATTTLLGERPFAPVSGEFVVSPASGDAAGAISGTFD